MAWSAENFAGMTSMRLALAAALCLLLALPSPVAADNTSASLVAPAANDAAARATVAALPRATAVNDADGNGVFDDLDTALTTAARNARLPVIVSFTEATGTQAGMRVVEQVAPAAVVRRTFTVIPAFAGDLTLDEVTALSRREEVRQIEMDRAGTPELDTATDVMGADAVVDELAITGSLDGQEPVASISDVGIAVLDTGIDANHAALVDKVVAWRDFGTNRPDPYDGNGHGTHVASIAAGWGDWDPALRGVAPGAALIGAKIDGGGNTTSNTIAAYEWLVAEGESLGVRIATISFGFGAATDGTTALERTIDAAWDNGIVCFKSNGNSGPGYGTMTVPAAARGILAIGSLLDPFGSGGSKYGFTLSEYSSRGPTTDGRIKPDLVAPGESIRAAARNTGRGSVVFSGTSMASPFAAGVAALMIAANPSLQPDQIRELLYATAEDRGASEPDNDFGYGRIQVWEAVAAASDLAGAPITQPNPTVVPVQETLAGTATTADFEATFEVTDTGFPVAATVLAEQAVLTAEVIGPGGSGIPPSTGSVNVPTGARQHHFTFQPSTAGTYTVRVTTLPGSTVTVDLSHSTAGPLP